MKKYLGTNGAPAALVKVGSSCTLMSQGEQTAESFLTIEGVRVEVFSGAQEL